MLLVFYIFAGNRNSMSLGKYLISRVFFGQILLSLAIIGLLGFLFVHWLTFATNHGDVVVVPNLMKLNEDQVEDKLDDLDLDYVLLDTMDYNPKYPKLSVVMQEPIAGMQVKEGRKVYIKINDIGYKSVKMPNLIQQTYRQVLPTLRALGLEEGTISYIPDIGKDMVMEMKLNGKPLKPGDKVLKSSKIDLVLGDGKIVYDETATDTLSLETPQIPVNEQ